MSQEKKYRESGLLKQGERLDDLQRDGLMIIQNPEWFCFGMDAVLLTAFVRAGKGNRLLDLGCGNGVIPLLLSAKTEGEAFEGLEIQEDIADMAARSVKLNRLEKKIHIMTGDIREASSYYEASSFDVITSNPPYMTNACGLTNEASHKAVARHELLCSLEDVVRESARLLKPGGHFFMVHRPFRLSEIMNTMCRHKLEPKRLRMVYPYVDREPNMVLIEGTRGGNQGMVVEKPLIVYEDINVYTKEVRELY
ncbi:MAG: tRNA1(Val) (adenine(37)-N6)-methyltransferase [Roseburia sp.]|nr:tRNA1(Val) (adenine(37)-N6)-methyltransferase [Roseburia sp.]